MKILVNLPSGFFDREYLRGTFARLERIGEVRQTSHNTPDEIRGDLAWADAVVMWSWPVLDEGLLASAPNLKFAGHLDLTQRGAKAELGRGLAVSLSKGGWSPAVAEMALGLVLAALRRISDYHREMRAGEEPWVARMPEDFDPRERQLTGRALGIIGFGAVGRRLGELVGPFRTELRVCDPFVPEEVLRAHGAARVELGELLDKSEVVVLCAASNEGTKKFIGAAELARLRPGAVFVNVARAALVDTEALVARLRKGDITAALDVFDKEPLEKDSPLRRLPNALLTPHRAGGLVESVQRVVGWLVDDLEAFREGRERKWAVSERMIPGLDA